MKLKFKKWYNEYDKNIRIHDYFSFMINQFPIIVIRKYDSPKEDDEYSIYLGLVGFTFKIKSNEIQTNKQ